MTIKQAWFACHLSTALVGRCTSRPQGAAYRVYVPTLWTDGMRTTLV